MHVLVPTPLAQRVLEYLKTQQWSAVNDLIVELSRCEARDESDGVVPAIRRIAEDTSAGA